MLNESKVSSENSKKINLNNRIYFHYCSVETFKNIINSKVFWLSNLTESNDEEEVSRTFINLWNAVKIKLLKSDLESNLVEKLIDVLDKQYMVELQVDKPYGVCFCKTGDLLQQWIEYGDRTRGVSLGFDFSWFNVLQKDMPHPNSNIYHAIGYDDVVYDNHLEDIFFNICYDSIKEHGPSAWIMGIRPTFKYYSAFIKNPTYFGENETRIVYYPDKDHINNIYNLTGPVDTPFIHYCLPWSDEQGLSALKVIVLGKNCILTKEDILSILTKAGLKGKILLFKSESSYRIKNR